MPFDGAEFLQYRLPENSSASAPTTAGWFKHWRSLLAWREATGKGFQAMPEERALAALRVLSDAKDLIATPRHWVQNRYEAPGDRYCAVGAVRLVGRHLDDPDALDAAHQLLLRVARGRGFRSVQKMNDRSTHEQVMTAFDEAIATARQRAVAAT
jgi:hypothetical protein